MKIAVCIKQVPTRDWQPRLNEARTWIREQDASYEMNEPDAYALEEALRLKEKLGGEVVVCSAGTRPCGAGAARGARPRRRPRHPRGGRRPRRRRRVRGAGALAAAMKDERSISFDRAAVRRPGVRADRRYPGGTPRLPPRHDHHGSAGRGRFLRVKRELEGGWFQWVTLPMPGVLTIQSGINQLRYATLKGIMAAKKKEIRTAARSASAAHQQIVSLYVPEKPKDPAHRGFAGRRREGWWATCATTRG